MIGLPKAKNTENFLATEAFLIYSSTSDRVPKSNGTPLQPTQFFFMGTSEELEFSGLSSFADMDQFSILTSMEMEQNLSCQKERLALYPNICKDLSSMKSTLSIESSGKQVRNFILFWHTWETINNYAFN